MPTNAQTKTGNTNKSFCILFIVQFYLFHIEYYQCTTYVPGVPKCMIHCKRKYCCHWLKLLIFKSRAQTFVKSVNHGSFNTSAKIKGGRDIIFDYLLLQAHDNTTIL